MKINELQRRELLRKFNLDINMFTAVTSRTSFFKGITKPQGKTTGYNYEQCFLVLAGCSMASIGLPLRYLDIVIEKLSSFKDLDFFRIIKEKKISLVLVPHSQDVVKSLFSKGGGKIKVDPRTLNIVLGGKYPGFDLSDADRNKAVPLVVLLEENDCKGFFTEPYNSVFSSFVVVRLFLLLEKLDSVFS